MKKIVLILLGFFFISVKPMYCQNSGNIWVFGDSVGLTFNSGQAIVLTQPVLSSHEPSSSISDSAGNLLFYVGSPTNFATQQFWTHKVWNQNHQLMPNGDSLMGNSSFTQGSLIIPDVINQDFYYIFHLGEVSGVGRYLYYSTVDMTANGGTGDVILKNIQLPILNNNSVTEKMIAVRHGNGRDWWLVVHDFDSTFCTFLVSPNGISPPIYQTIGCELSGYGSAGQMQISPDGTKLVVVGDYIIDLYDYNRCTGTISNWVYLGDTLRTYTGKGYYGGSFSPNSQLLYVSNLDTLFQFDLNVPIIGNSRIMIFNDTCPQFCHIGQHLLGPDNKIYIANASGFSFGNTIYDSFNMSISYIENPNSPGLSCNFNYLGQYLNGKRSFFGLPNIPIYGLGSMAGSACDTITSFHHLEEENQITVKYYQNRISINIKNNEPYIFLLLNSSGQIVVSQKLNSSLSLDMNHSSGIYLYEVITEENLKHYTGKLNVMRD